MKTIYNVELSARMYPEEFTQIADSEWRHCADNMEAIVNFLVQVLHKREDFGAVKCTKIIVARYIEWDEPGFYQWEGDTIVPIEEVNKLIQDHRDYENLYNHLMEACQKFNLNVKQDDRGIFDDKWNLCYQEFIEFE